MQLHQHFGERQAEAGTFVLAVQAAIDLAEALEGFVDIFLAHADTGVLHGDNELRRLIGDSFGACGDMDLATLAGELDRKSVV